MSPIPKHKTGLQSKWAAKPRSNEVSAEEARRQNETWQILNDYIVQNGGMVISPPGKMLRVEVQKDSLLPAQLSKLGFRVWACGSTTRTGGEMGFVPVDVIEIAVDGR